MYKIFLTTVASLLLLLACSNQENSESATSDQAETTPKENSLVENEKMHRQIGFLTFDESSFQELSPELKSLHNSIIQNTNYASGVSVANIMLEANDILNMKLGSDTGAVYEDQLKSAHVFLKGNPRKSGKNFNQAGRWLCRKYFDVMSASYPTLGGQVGEMKELLGHVNPHYPLLGQQKQVRAFIDQCFVTLYLMEEKEKENSAVEE